MKKLYPFILLLAWAPAAQAVGVVQQSIQQLGTSNNWVLAFNWTGDAANGTIPNTIGQLGGCCQGYFPVAAEVIPGSPSPTNGYNLQILDGAGVDILGGAAAGLSSTLPQSFAPSSSAPPLQGALVLAITGQLVPSAKGVVYVFLSKPGNVNLATLGRGGGNATISGASLNGSVYWNGSSLKSTATGGAGTLCVTSTNGGTPIYSSCAGSASTIWSSLSNPTSNLALSMGAFGSTFTTGTGTGTNNIWVYQDTTGNTGTGTLFLVSTVGTSTLKPFTVTAQGTINGIQMNTSGLLSTIGTGGISATHINNTLLSSLGTGVLKLTVGVPSLAVGGTDFAPPTAGTGILKGSGTGGFSTATGGVDYEFPLTFGAGLNRSGNTITIPANGVTNAMLAGSIATSKMASLTGAGGILVTNDGTHPDGCATWITGNVESTGSPCGAGGGGGVSFQGTPTATAIVTDFDTTHIQTPSANATMDSSGNVNTPGAVASGVGSGGAGAIGFAGGTQSVSLTPQPSNSVGFVGPSSAPSGKHFYALPSTGSGANQIFVFGAEASNVSTPTLTTFAYANLTDALTSAHVMGTNASKVPVAATGHDTSAILLCADTSASATTYTCTTTPSFNPSTGDMVLFTSINQANSGSSTLNVNSAGAKTIKKQQNAANLIASDLATGGAVIVEYDGTNWEMQGQIANAPAGNATAIASGQTAVPTSALAGNSCDASATTATATGAATTDAAEVTYASDPTGLTGYGGGTSGGITIRSWLTTNTFNFKRCNETGSSITPSALNINWRVVR